MSNIELAEIICSRIPEDRRPTPLELLNDVETFVDRVMEMRARDAPA